MRFVNRFPCFCKNLVTIQLLIFQRRLLIGIDIHFHLTILTHIKLNTVLYNAYHILYILLPAIISLCLFIDNVVDSIVFHRKSRDCVLQQIQYHTNFIP